MTDSWKEATERQVERMRAERLKIYRIRRIRQSVIIQPAVTNWFHTKWICAGGMGWWNIGESYDIETREEIEF